MKYLPLLILLVGCAMVNPSITGSSAPGKVQRDIGHLLVYVDAGKAPECKERRHITASPLPSDKPGTTVERWAVKRCDTTKYYIITWTPNPQDHGYDTTFKPE